MLASYLAYGLGKKVAVLDYDTPTHHLLTMRREEVRMAKSNPDSALARFLVSREGMDTPFDIINFDIPNCSVDDVRALISLKGNFAGKGYDYLFLDFPGRFDGASLAQKALCLHAADLVVVPVDTDRQTLESALFVCSNLVRNDFRNVLLFWNKVKLADRRTMAEAFPLAEKPFRELGLEFSEYWINDFVKAGRDSSTKFFVRSTLCWPEVNARMSSPNLKHLYDDILRRV